MMESDFSSTASEGGQAQHQRGASPPNPPPNQDVTDALVGRNLGHYRVEARLGSGAMAAVYRATDSILERQVALKILLPGADTVVRERFRQEARTVSILDHPNIVRTLQVGQTDGITYIAMDLVEGSNLADLLGEQGRMSVADSCRLLEPVARALAYAHRNQVVHRDVKPSNILLRRLPAPTAQSIYLAQLGFAVYPLLSDFGIALAMDSPELTAAGRTVGTPTYMAPEQAADSHEIDGRADIYALGIVLYRCLVGRPPFVGSTTQILHAHVYEPLTIPEENAAQLPPLVLETLQRMLAKDPADRYPDANLLADDLALAGGAARRDPAGDPPTATLQSVPTTGSSVGIERLRVLANAPGTRTARRTPLHSPAVPKLPLPGRDEPVLLRPSSARPARPRRNWLAVGLGAVSALALFILAILILRTLLPSDGLFPRPAAATATALAAQTAPATPDGEPVTTATTTPAVADVATPAPPPPDPPTAVAPGALVPAVAISTLIASTSAPTTTALITATQPTVPLDIELYWGIAVDDFERRDWNNALGNLLYILRIQSSDFGVALARGEEPQAQLVRGYFLDKPDEPFWVQVQPLFDQERFASMLFDIYVAQGTVKNAEREPMAALEHFNSALIVRPDDPVGLELRDATERFLTADDADRDQARSALGASHQQYGQRLADADDLCGASDQLEAAVSLTQNADLEARLTEYRRECAVRQQVIAGRQLLGELRGGILYSTEEAGEYRIYYQPLAPDAQPTLLVRNGRQPRLSPDQRTLAFYSAQTTAPGLAYVQLSGGFTPADRTKLFTSDADDAHDSPPTWSADGGRLAFASVREADNRQRIYLKAAEPDGEIRALVTGQDPAWRPLGESWIAYSGRDPEGNLPGILLINDVGTSWHRLTIFERDRRPAWAPNAQTIFFMSDGRDGNWEIYRAALTRQYEVEEITRLTENPSQDGLPTVSPDGKWVAYASDQGNQWRIWVTQADGSVTPLPVAEFRGALISWLEHSIQWVAN